ncbi:hypothetical protein Hanom_Chr03g00255501 [Helianthus anomalus]
MTNALFKVAFLITLLFNVCVLEARLENSVKKGVSDVENVVEAVTFVPDYGEKCNVGGSDCAHVCRPPLIGLCVRGVCKCIH